MKTKNFLLVLVCLFVIFSCKKSIRVEKSAVENCDMAPLACMVPEPPGAINQSGYNPKLIKKGVLVVSTTELEETKEVIYKFVKDCEGYVTTENLVRNDPDSYYNISLNIKASHFDKFLRLLDSSKLNIVSRNFSVEDVTLQYVDDSTRLINKKKLEKRYLELLSKTKDIKDMIEIEEKLEEIQSDIEVKENQMKIMDKQIAYSVISLKIEKKTSSLTYDNTNKYTYKLGQGLAKGWEAIKSFVVLLMSIWPLYLVVALVYFIIRAKIRKKKAVK